MEAAPPGAVAGPSFPQVPVEDPFAKWKRTEIEAMGATIVYDPAELGEEVVAEYVPFSR